MSNAHPNYVENSIADGGFESFKKTLAYQGKSNVATIERHKDKVFALAVAGDLLYTASDSKDIRVFRAPMFKEVDCFGSGSGVVHSLMAFEDKLYSAHQDNKIRVWKIVKSGDNKCKHKSVTVLPRLEQCVKSMLLKRNYVHVRRQKKKLWIEHADGISALALGCGRKSEASGGGWCPPSVLYSASWDKSVKVWNLNSFKCMESFSAHHDAINAMIVIDGSILATASADHTIKLWTRLSYPTKRKKHGLINTLEGHKVAVNALAVSENFKILYSGGSDGSLIVWKKVYSRKDRSATSSIKSAVSGTLSGEVLTQNGSNEIGKISRTRSLAKQRSIKTGKSSNLSGEVLLSIGSSESEEISRAKSVTNQGGLSSIKKVVSHYNRLGALSSNSVNFVEKKVLIGHTRAVLSVSTVRDNIVCSSSADKTIRVWERAAEKRWEYACIAVLAGHGGPVKAIASVTTRAHSHYSSMISHAQEQCQHVAAIASHYNPIAAAEDDQGIIVYSAGLDSKVKVWALNIRCRR